MTNDPIFAWASLAIGAAGLITAIVALVWQAVTWRFTGVRVRVATSLGITSYWGKDARSVLTVTARNLGRTSIEASGWGVRLPDGRDWVATRQLPGSANSHFTLEGLHSASWVVPLHLLSDAVGATDSKVELCGWTTLGTGDRVVSKPIRVDGSHIAEQGREFADNPIPM